MIRERASADRQEALKQAYLALRPSADAEGRGQERTVEVSKIKDAIQHLRPHYNQRKIDALVLIIDPNHCGRIGFSDFRIRMQKVLHTSLRSARQISRQSVFLASLSLFVAIANLTYVLLLSSALEFLLLSNLIFPVGSIIVALGLAEVILRLRPCGCLSTLLTTRHSVLDGLAVVASLVSSLTT